MVWRRGRKINEGYGEEKEWDRRGRDFGCHSVGLGGVVGIIGHAKEVEREEGYSGE